MVLGFLFQHDGRTSDALVGGNSTRVSPWNCAGMRPPWLPTPSTASIEPHNRSNPTNRHIRYGRNGQKLRFGRESDACRVIAGQIIWEAWGCRLPKLPGRLSQGDSQRQSRESPRKTRGRAPKSGAGFLDCRRRVPSPKNRRGLSTRAHSASGDASYKFPVVRLNLQNHALRLRAGQGIGRLLTQAQTLHQPVVARLAAFIHP